MRGDFVGHLVALEDVLQRADPDAELLHRAHEGKDFILPVGVAMNPPLGLDDLPQRLEFEIAPWGWAAFLAEAPPLAVVLPRGGEAVLVEGRDAHPGLWEARVFVVAPVGLLHVLAQRKLDAGRRGLELDRFRPLAKPQLDDGVLAADRVGGAVQQIGHSQSAGELAQDFRRLRVDDVADRDHRRGGQGAFVDRAEDHAVVVGVDETGGDMFALGVNHVRLFR